MTVSPYKNAEYGAGAPGVKCQAFCKPQWYRGHNERCKMRAKISIKGGPKLCVRHAGKYLVANALAEKRASYLPVLDSCLLEKVHYVNEDIKGEQ